MNHPHDTLIQKHFPVIMVPQYGTLAPCPHNRSRLLMSKKGLFIESQRAWGKVCGQLWRNSRSSPLPYGEIKANFRDCYSILKQLSPILNNDIIPAAAAFADRGLEWAGWVMFKDGALMYAPLEFKSSEVHVTAECLKVSGWTLVVDIHSHNTMRAGFSPKDDQDDKGGVRICMVVGSYSAKDGQPTFAYRLRLIMEGYFFDLDYKFNDLPMLRPEIYKFVEEEQ